MEVPARELVDKTEFAGIPEEFNTTSTGKVPLVRRFDRGMDGARVHMEDFAQVFGRYPSEKMHWRGVSQHRGSGETDKALDGAHHDCDFWPTKLRLGARQLTRPRCGNLLRVLELASRSESDLMSTCANFCNY
jgi:hypothetical protein